MQATDFLRLLSHSKVDASNWLLSSRSCFLLQISNKIVIIIELDSNNRLKRFMFVILRFVTLVNRLVCCAKCNQIEKYYDLKYGFFLFCIHKSEAGNLFTHYNFWRDLITTIICTINSAQLIQWWMVHTFLEHLFPLMKVFWLKWLFCVQHTLYCCRANNKFDFNQLKWGLAVVNQNALIDVLKRNFLLQGFFRKENLLWESLIDAFSART